MEFIEEKSLASMFLLIKAMSVDLSVVAVDDWDMVAKNVYETMKGCNEKVS